MSDGHASGAAMEPGTVISVETRHSSGFHHKRPIVLAGGEGAVVWDAQGRRYIDCDTGHGLAILGHGHPAVTAAIKAQAEKLLTCGESFYSEPRARLYAELAAAMPAGLDRFFLCNSGTEAVEGALKLARLTTGRSRVVAFRGGFHGRTFGSLSATWNPRYREPFAPLLDGFAHVPFNDAEAAAAAVTPEVGAVLVEPVQGEGGIHVATGGFLARLREACDSTGALLVFDEVQTGVGRTGAFVAAQRFGVTPDVICLAKGLAGGVPIGAVAFGERVGEVPRGAHASTFGGNPLAAAAAAATVAIVRKDRLAERAAELGERFLGMMRQLAGEARVVREVRGLGLMIAMDLKTRSARYLQALQDRGVLALAAGPTVVRLLPPLVITWEQLEAVRDALALVLMEDPPQ
ncbi:MAG: aspartate aminotransferase family protein [Bacillota bacterium]|nr:aspartate aminotransferase family protein [Bacillota bacterium]